MIRTPAKLKGVCGIYGVIHRDSGRVYVGQSRDIASRRRKHRLAVKENSQSHFHCALRKYGEDAFDFEILEECAPEVLTEREHFYIRLMDAVKNGLNLAATPSKSRFGVKASDETRAKISAKLSGRKLSDEHRNKISKRQIGTRMSDEAKAKLRDRWIGTKRKSEDCRKISEGQTGRVWSEESRVKLGNSHRGKSISKWHAQRVAEANSKAVVQLHPETKAEIAEFPSARAAARYLNCDPSGIGSAAKASRGATKCAGFSWAFKN